MSIKALVSEFLESYEPPIRALTTCRLMRQSLRELTEDGSIEIAADLSPSALWRWMRRRPDRRPITSAVHLRNLRVFCNYAVGRGQLVGSPFVLDAKLRKATHVKKVFRKRHHSLVEIGCVLGYLRDRAARSRVWEDLRLHALASTVAFTGARAREVSFSEVKDYDLVEGFLMIEPKPNHPLKTDSSEREVPLPPPLVAILADWLPRARSRWAFPGSRRVGPWDGGGPGYRPGERLRQAGESVGVPGFTFLSLRHSFITHGSGPWGLASGSIQLIAGHSIEETQRHYLGRDRDNLREAVATIAFPIPSARPRA